MPRDAVALTNLTANAGTAEPAGTAINVANGAVVSAAPEGSRLVLRVTNTNGTQRTVTVKAGANPPSLRAGIGDLAVVVPATTGVRYITLETARFLQADGSINIDFEASMAGVVQALVLPKAV